MTTLLPAALQRLLYSALVTLLLPLLPLRLLWRARRSRSYLHHALQRFGMGYPAVPQPVIWVHAVSVGETRAGSPLIRRLQALYPNHTLLLTHMTPTGRETGRQLFGESVVQAYLPYDHPCLIRAFLRAFRPQLGIILETELWVNLIHGCRKADIPLYLVNARLSARSAKGYARLPGLARAALQGFAGVAAQTGDDACRLAQLGAAAPVVTGNLKFDVTPDPDVRTQGARLKALLGHRKVLICASTRDGEERLLLDAWQQAGWKNYVLVIVPRHPERFDEVADALAQRGIPYRRKSGLGTPITADLNVVLGDTMGELYTYYAAADLAFVGGSLQPLGGQNLIEPLALGVPVLIGPSTYNFQQVASEAVAAGCALRVADAGAVLATAAHLLQEEEERRRMSAQATAFVRIHQGAVERTMALIAPAGEA